MTAPEGVVVYSGDCLAILPTIPAESVDSIVTDPPAGIAFMGKTWDKDKGGRDAWIRWMTGVMSEAYRVLKPGGHALVWALPRTAHWTATALEDAGFEIRDCVVHLFGTGFPKGTDVGKAIDRASGAERQDLGPGQWAHVKAGGTWNGHVYGGEPSHRSGPRATAPASPDAVRWDGWNTSLKPGHEQWWLVRKPLRGTVASNVLAYGTGAINVDGCRVSVRSGDDQTRQRGSSLGYHGARPGTLTGGGSDGRWPANLVITHSASCDEAGLCAPDCPAGELDAQSGISTSRAAPRGGTSPNPMSWGAPRADGDKMAGHDDAGGASRFYPAFRYQAKAPRSERPTVDGVIHPTVKSLALMRWLVRLITPPGGTVLDMFAGSGATLEAAHLEGFKVIGVEADPDYVKLIRARLKLDGEPR